MSELPDDDNTLAGAVNVEPRIQPKKVFVTGASGLVGSHLIYELLSKGISVKAFYRTEIPAIIGKEKVLWVKGDILDVLALDEVMEGVEQVYHCAAIVSFNSRHASELYQTNIQGTANVVNASLTAGVKKLCFVSSVSALGKNVKDITITESTGWSEESNSSNYGKSKYLAEVEVWRGVAEGLQCIIVNPSIILGAGDWNKGSTKIFKTAYEEFPWFTEGVTGFVDVTDVAKAMIQLMDSDIKNERFIVSAENRKYKEVFTMAAKAFSKKPPYKKVSKLTATIVRQLASIKSMFLRDEPLLTKETAQAAQDVVYIDNSKLLKFLPSFTYTPIQESIRKICMQLIEKNHLK